MKLINYKGFVGSIDVDSEGNCLYGKLLYINDLITYEAQTVKKLELEFRKAVDDYIQTCEQLGREPAKPFKGSLNIRLGSELHKEAALHAAMQNMTINEYIKVAVKGLIVREGNRI